MKSTLIAILILLSSSMFAQQALDWSKWNWLMGEWQGEGSGKPGQGSGTFSFTPDLNQRILVRKSHSEYPSRNGPEKVSHDDLMIIYPDNAGVPAKAIYFDNEGHTISYSVVCSGDAIVMTSEKMSNAPVFRLTYTLLENKIVDTKFEMSQDGSKFVTYIQGKSKKVNG